METRKVDVFKFRDGKIVSFMEYFDNAAPIASTVVDR